jgi:biopolymer transport protein ExbB
MKITSRTRTSVIVMTGLLLVAAASVLAQTTGAPAAPASAPVSAAAGAPIATGGAPAEGVWPLFMKSFDFFTILLLTGSVVAGAYIFRCLIEIRGGAICPRAKIEAMRDLVRANRIGELRGYVERDNSFPGAVVRAALRSPRDKDSMRDAAELAASEQIAHWFRKIEPLNVIGNLGPLIGLAGTVWGMVIAFSTLGQAGGQAYAGELASGISKALFHTLLGLMLAIPCLVVFGYYRTIVDRHCNRAMVVCSELVESIPAEGATNGMARAAAALGS